jgi:predicted unusual protein kinase regulating ubiquinone biosynthesis (AarF/ABC1/UbiB family)
MNSSIPEQRVRLVYYDFGQAADLQQNQADGILDILEAIVDMDVDRSVESFQKMEVLKEGADLAAVRAKVADNYKTGKIKANRKKLKKLGYKFKVFASEAVVNETNAIRSVTAVAGGNTTDAQVMQYFTLPAEYAFVARALSQMNGVGKSLDPDFDFVSSAAPWIYEIKGAGLYVKDEALKRLTNLRNQICERLFPWHFKKTTPVLATAQEVRPANATMGSFS